VTEQAEQAAQPAEAEPPVPAKTMRVLQRVVFPSDDLDVVPLYAETKMERGAGELTAEMLMNALGKGGPPMSSSASADNAITGEAQTSIRFGAATPGGLVGEVLPRRTAAITPDRRVSFATYFNAFPASYWRRWTKVEAVTLRIRLAGEATIVIYRSAAKGHSHPIETIRVHNDEPQTIERTLSLVPFIDGGWYWFDIVAGPRGTTLIEADWAAPADPVPPGRVSIGITTFNRASYLLDLLRSIGDAPDTLELLDAVYVVDQGTAKVKDHPDFADATKELGEKLHVIEQGNLGGSGGFSRAMDETLRAGTSHYVLILDDDIRLEPESVLRAGTFADLARKPTIVGGHMFSMYDPSVLHAYAEVVAAKKWWWGAAPGTRPRHDFGRRNLRNTPWLHRRADSDYNGWWTCLIPTKIITEIGLSLPVFIKWDDAEYALRARKSGYPTVSMPGVAAWHVPWMDKNDALDWQAYYHLRNRLVTALLHSQFSHGGQLVYESAERQLQNLLSLQYSTAALRLLAVEDVLSGPGHLHRDLPVKMAQLRELRQPYSDAQSSADINSFPPPRRRPAEYKPPTDKIGLMRRLIVGVAHQLRPVRESARKRPQVALPHIDSPWYVLSKLDSALVSLPDGTGASWYQRDPKVLRSLGWRSAVMHWRLRRRWPKLAAQYRAACPDFTSPQRWRETFAVSQGDSPGGQ
jgi:galactofuranosylgalactofuranosylrhamnosyl-N-acetylglucosaminyl-diphospho-decaprenol beta-1,5/1,6-galactofuranosyltransferase